MSLHEATEELETQAVRPSLLTSGARPLRLGAGKTWRGGVSFLPDGRISAHGWPMCAAEGGVGGANTIHELTVSANSGNIVLSWPSGDSGAIAHTADTVAVTAALEAHPQVAAGDVTVTGGPLNTAPVQIEYVNNLAGLDIALPEIIDNLSPGWASAEITKTQDGYDPDALSKIDANWHPVPEVAAFEPIGLYTADACDYLGHPAGIDWAGRVQTGLEDHIAYLLAEEMMSAEWSKRGPRTNPSLQSSAEVTGTGSAEAIHVAVAALLAAWQNPDKWRLARQPVLHAPWFTLPLMEEAGLLQRQGSMLTTAGGTVTVSPGPGYSGHAPDDSAPDAGEVWLYMSGIAEYATEGIVTRQERLDNRRMNRVVEIAEDAGIIVFDPTTVYATRALIA